MANLSKASNVVQEKYILYDVTGFTQKWHSIPVATTVGFPTGAQTLRVQKKVTILWPQQTSQLRARTHWGSGRCPRSDAFAYSEAPPRNQA